MQKTRVGVLRGGPSAEYDVSLKSGQTVLTHLPKDKYQPIDIYVDKQGLWHLRGRPMDPGRALAQVDVVFNALHGAYGEDGTVQRIMDTHGARYTGSGSLASALAMQKHLAKERLGDGPFHRANHRMVRAGEADTTVVRMLARDIGFPLVVKPANGGSSIATFIVRAEEELLYVLAIVFEHTRYVLVERYVAGREVTVAVAEEYRGQRLYAFPPVEIVATKGAFFDYDEKYGGGARELCPAPLPRQTTEQLLEAARFVHATLGLRDYSRSDFIVHDGGICFLEVNTLPGLTETSLVPKAVHAVGATLPSFLDHLVSRALVRR